MKGTAGMHMEKIVSQYVKILKIKILVQIIISHAAFSMKNGTQRESKEYKYNKYNCVHSTKNKHAKIIFSS